MLRLVHGDITAQEVDAIVNAANSTLLGGGGVDGAIHRHGGPTILDECRALRSREYPGGLPTGKAVGTTAGELSAKRVIHTVGPIWHGGTSGEPAQLANAWTNSLRLAHDEGLRTIAFPSISTGAYGYPTDRAARIAIAAVNGFLTEYPDAFDEIRVVLFSEADLATWTSALEESEG